MQMLQHVWTYKPLVHDVLSMQANSVTIDIKAEAGQLPGTTSKKRFEVGAVSHWQLLQCIARVMLWTAALHDKHVQFGFLMA